MIYRRDIACRRDTAWWAWLAIFAAALLGACSGGGHGADTVVAPTAVVTPLGYQATTSSGTSMIAVRSGADVQISGKDSVNGHITITSFAWQQTDESPVPQVALLYRNSNTVSFTAPSVGADTTLNFKLTVANAAGLTATATAQVVVKAANDPNRFLTAVVGPGQLPVPHHFRVGVSTVAGLANLGADVPVCVSLARTLSYTPRSGGANAGSLKLATRQVDAKWLAAVGGAAGFTAPAPSYTNPEVSFGLPSLNDEDIFAQFNTPAGDVNQQLVPSDVDTAYVQMAVTAAPGSCDGTASGDALTGSTLMLQLYDETGVPIGASVTAPGPGIAVTMSSLAPAAMPNPLTPDGSANLSPDGIIRAESQRSSADSVFETRESATAYYAALDPTSSKATLTAWLAANCFDANDADYGAGESGYSVVHGVYTNNYDLGFGRDMYFANCTNGNMASVVINYPSLQGAANKIGAFLAVAMEYSAPAGSSAACFANPADPTTNTGACFTKFYSFAPDDRTGEFKRILSANFDRRGQKYVPGSCTACHGGTSAFASGKPYPNSGNIDSNFLPWDVGTLLFGDTDPAFSCKTASTNPNCVSIKPASYARAAQEPAIQQLNALAWRTYQYVEPIGSNHVDRNRAPRDLLTQWYGGDPAASTAHAFDDSATPSGWFTAGQTASSPDDLYHSVYAHYCRSCHTELAAVQFQFSTYAAFANVFGPRVGLGAVTGSVFNAAQMPLSRLTMDRFWQDFAGGKSAAQALADYVNSVPGTTAVPTDASGKVIGSGVPQVVIPAPGAPSPLTALSTTATNVLASLPGIALDAVSQSLFIASYQWSLCTVGPPATAGGPCPGSTLGTIGTPLMPAGGSAGAAEAGAGVPAFPTTVSGLYYLTLNAKSGILGATPSVFTYKLMVP